MAAAGVSTIIPREMGLLQLRPDLGHGIPRPLHLGHCGDHGEHELHRPQGGGPEDSRQLGMEDLGVVQAVADRPISQKGIVLLGNVQIGDVLVSAHIQRAHNEGAAGQAGDNGGIGLVLAVLIRD